MTKNIERLMTDIEQSIQQIRDLSLQEYMDDDKLFRIADDLEDLVIAAESYKDDNTCGDCGEPLDECVCETEGDHDETEVE